MLPPTLHSRGCAIHARQHVRLRTLGSRLGVAAPRAQAAENGPSRLSTNVGNVDSVRGRTQQPQVPSKPPAGVQVHAPPTYDTRVFPEGVCGASGLTSALVVRMGC